MRQANPKINKPLIKQKESTNERFSSVPANQAGGNQADERFLSPPANQAGGNERFLSGPTRPKPVAGNDSSGWFRSHEVVDIPREPIVRRRSSCFLYFLYLLGVMLATWFLYQIGCMIYFMIRVK